MTRLVLLTTCGASVLTDGAAPAVRAWLREGATVDELGAANQRRLDAIGAEVTERLRAASDADRAVMSPELAGIRACIERWPTAEVRHLLLHADTPVCATAAGVLRELLGPEAQLLTTPGLRPHTLRGALPELVRLLRLREPRSKLVFHLTAGFKQSVALLWAIGLADADACVTLSTEGLVEIPGVPISLPHVNEIAPFTLFFRRSRLGYCQTAAEARELPTHLVELRDGQAFASVWGELAWARARGELLGKEIFNPLSRRLRFSPGLLRAAAGLDREQRIALNETLDGLSAWFDLERPMPAALQPIPDGMRLGTGPHAPFGHYEGRVFVLDGLDPV